MINHVVKVKHRTTESSDAMTQAPGKNLHRYTADCSEGGPRLPHLHVHDFRGFWETGGARSVDVSENEKMGAATPLPGVRVTSGQEQRGEHPRVL